MPIGAGPGQCIRHDPGIVAKDLARDTFDPPGHLGRRAPRKRHQQNSAGVRALDDPVGDAMGEGVGLAGTRSGNDEQWCRGESSRGAMLDRTPLFGIEGFEVRGCCLHRRCPSMFGRRAVSDVGNQGSPFVLSPNRHSFRSNAYMASRANWKDFLRLSLVTCPVALYPATSESEKITFNQLNRKSGHRIK